MLNKCCCCCYNVITVVAAATAVNGGGGGGSGAYARAAQTFSILGALVDFQISQGNLCHILTSTL
jgi:hypothetical protein